jgi:hypothetical protein
VEEGIIARKYYEVIDIILWQASVFVNACCEGIRKKILTNFWDHFLNMTVYTIEGTHLVPCVKGTVAD